MPIASRKLVRTRAHGMSLIELVVALGIVGALLAGTAALANGLPLARAVQEESVARAIATNELETLRAGGYAALPASGTFSDSLMSDLPAAFGALTVSDYDSDTKDVAVTVSWQGTDGASRSITLTTLIVDTGGLP